MTNIKKNTRMVAAFCIGILLIVSVSLSALIISNSNAKFTEQEEESYIAELQDFDVNFTLSYVKNGVLHTVTDGEINEHNGVLRLSSEDYKTLRLDIEYTGKGKCFCRFRITESWQHDENGTDVITPKQLSVYTLDPCLYDNRSDDGYIYCTEALMDETKEITAVSHFTAGADAVNLIDNTNDRSQFVDISVELEAVQWNRATEFWKLDKLPWM